MSEQQLHSLDVGGNVLDDLAHRSLGGNSRGPRLTTGTDAIFPDSHLSILKQAEALFSQQVWCWGQDVLHPQGNLLMKFGFERVPPPPDRRDCSSVYSLTINSTQRLILRSFGVFWGDDDRGGLLLLRDRFESRYLQQARLEKPCWSLRDFPIIASPTLDQRPKCIEMLIGLIDWIRQYELRILRECGLSYRQQALDTWDNGRRHVLPPEGVPAAWRRCSHLIAEHPIKFLPMAKW